MTFLDWLAVGGGVAAGLYGLRFAVLALHLKEGGFFESAVHVLIAGACIAVGGFLLVLGLNGIPA